MGKIIVIFHLAAVIHFMFGLYYSGNLPVPHTKEFERYHAPGGMLKYLTVWNMLIQSFFFWICLANDIWGTNEITLTPNSGIRRFKDALFCSIAFPLSAFVSTTFWGLYAIDRELVLPRVMDQYFPTWLNHIMHTNIFIWTLLELFFVFRMYPPRNRNLTIFSSFMVIYVLWVFFIYYKTGHWVYPVMDALNWPGRVTFCLGLLVVGVSFYFLGEWTNNIVWKECIETATTMLRGKKH